jgi:hypothetical protein
MDDHGTSLAIRSACQIRLDVDDARPPRRSCAGTVATGVALSATLHGLIILGATSLQAAEPFREALPRLPERRPAPLMVEFPIIQVPAPHEESETPGSTLERNDEAVRHRATGFFRITPIPGLSVLADGEYDSSRFSSSDGVQVAGSYFVASARARNDAPFGVSAQVELRNLFDRNYVLQEGYPEPGRTIFASLGYRL